MIALTQRVLAQTRARVLRGDKVLSVFEPHTEAIRKGKTVKPTQFGKLVKVQEAESQFITDYQVCAERVPDGDLWTVPRNCARGLAIKLCARFVNIQRNDAGEGCSAQLVRCFRRNGAARGHQRVRDQ